MSKKSNNINHIILLLVDPVRAIKHSALFLAAMFHGGASVLLTATLLVNLILPFPVWAQVENRATNLGANPKAPFSKINSETVSVPMYSTPAGQLYRVRVLLEDHNNWPEAYDLLQSFINNSPDLDPVFEKKLKKAANQVALYLPKRVSDQLLNRRMLVQPFLEAQYLINEVLMDMRVVLNNSTDYEVQVVDDFLQTYFFPGFEEYGVIKYPDLSKYSFDLYALTPENLLQAKREPSNRALKPSTLTKDSKAVDPEYFNREVSKSVTKVSGPQQVLPMSVQNLRALERLRIEERIRYEQSTGLPPAEVKASEMVFGAGEGSEDEETVPRGFLQELIDLGIAVEFIAETARDLWKSIGNGNRVMNRYLPQSLLMQAIAEPGAAILDPQLQDFLSEVRLELKIAEIQGPVKDEISFLQETLGAEHVEKISESQFRIRLEAFQDNQRPGTQSYVSLAIKRSPNASKAAVYLVTGVGGADLARLQMMQSLLVALRDYQILKEAGAYIPKIPGLAGAGSFALSGMAELAKKIPEWSAAMLAAARESKNSLSALVNYTGGYTLKVIEGTNKLAGVSGKLAGSSVGKKVKSLVAHPQYEKYVKSGKILTVLTVMTATLHGVVGAVEYSYEEDFEERNEIYKKTISKVGGTLLYLVPKIGIIVAAVDTLHVLVGFPFEGADLFRLGFWSVEAATYMGFYGTTKTKVYLSKLESEFVVPVDPVMYERFLVPRVKDLESVEAQLSGLYAYHQNTAQRHLSLMYVAHRTYVDPKEGVYQYGERVMEYYHQFQKTKKVFDTNREHLRSRRVEALKDLMEAKK